MESITGLATILIPATLVDHIMWDVMQQLLVVLVLQELAQPMRLTRSFTGLMVPTAHMVLRAMTALPPRPMECTVKVLARSTAVLLALITSDETPPWWEVQELRALAQLMSMRSIAHMGQIPPANRELMTPLSILPVTILEETLPLQEAWELLELELATNMRSTVLMVRHRKPKIRFTGLMLLKILRTRPPARLETPFHLVLHIQPLVVPLEIRSRLEQLEPQHLAMVVLQVRQGFAPDTTTKDMTRLRKSPKVQAPGV